MIREVVSVPGGIFDLLRADFDSPYEIGSWFWVDNKYIFVLHSGKRFAKKDGEHPVVTRTRYNPGRHGPNVTCYPRSASSRTGFVHEAHCPPCRINLPGMVLLHLPVVVKSSEISATTFSCCEETNSELMSQIGITS